MPLESYYKILRIPPGSSPKEIKEAYHQAAKRNHPDLFLDDQRHSQQLRMMKINEAYIAIASHRRSSGTNGQRPESDATDGEPIAPREPSPDSKEVGDLKDPAYTYYKLGFRHYGEARRSFFQRVRVRPNRIHYMINNRELLSLALASLRLFERSFSYFIRVIEDYPDSIWCRDARTKIHYIERYNEIYRRICRSITSQIDGKPSRHENGQGAGSEAAG